MNVIVLPINYKLCWWISDWRSNMMLVVVLNNTVHVAISCYCLGSFILVYNVISLFYVACNDKTILNQFA